MNGPLNQRTIGLSLAELARVPQIVGIARGVSKARSIAPLLEKGYLKTLITDQETAQEILRLNQREIYLRKACVKAFRIFCNEKAQIFF